MYSAYKLNKQGDNIHPWCTPFPIWNLSVVPCPVLTVACWPAYRFHKRQAKLSVYCDPHKGFSEINEAGDVLLQFSCFFYDPMDVVNLISGSLVLLPFLNPASTSGSSWFTLKKYCWGLAWKNFVHYFATLWNECNCVCSGLKILWHCPSMRLGWKLTFSSPVAMAEFSISAGILVQHFNSIIF